MLTGAKWIPLANIQLLRYDAQMETTPEIWIAACAHELQRRWRTVEPEQLEEVAGDLWKSEGLRLMTPARAATEWLRPVVRE